MSLSIFKKLFGPGGEAGKSAGNAALGTLADPEFYSLAAIDKLAEDLPARKGVWWSAEAAKEVEDKLPEEEVKAAEAAAEWAMEPSEETEAKVKEALEEVEFQGPGSWAAQAAEWAIAAGAMGISAVPAVVAGGAPTAAALVPQAVAGSVKLAAAMAADQMPEPEDGSLPESPENPQDALPDPRDEDPAALLDAAGDSESNGDDDVPSPEELHEQAEALKPFIDKGNEIAEIDEPWKDMVGDG
ncbi:MAG: hypothetical protein EA377_02805 [Phycisphaerales bacterium]|nr:MAG: hypothetical protein EA377_02805 [Phycisphaerales bacterium]